MLTRCCWPPESWPGMWSSRPSSPSRTALLPALIAPDVGVDSRDFDVVLHAEIGNQVVTLEDKSDMSAAQTSQLVRCQMGGVLAADVVVTAIRHVEAAHDVHQRRLDGARGADNRQQLTDGDGQLVPFNIVRA